MTKANDSSPDPQKDLAYALKTNQTNVVKQYLQSIGNVNAPLSGVFYLLPLAAKYKNLEIVSAFIEKGVNINSTNREGKTALHFAIENDDFEMLKFLIKHQATLDVKDKKGKTPLFYACVKKKSQKITELLLALGANPNLTFVVKKEKTTLLHEAVYQKADTLIKTLCYYGADVNKKNERNESSAHFAYRHYPIALEYMFKNYNVDLNSTNKCGKTFLQIALEEENMPFTSFLLKNGADIFAPSYYSCPFIDACTKRKDEFMYAYLRAYSKSNELRKDDKFNDYVPFAGRIENFWLLKVLCRVATNLNQKNDYGYTALHYLGDQNSPSMMQELIEYGADPHIKNNQKQSPIMLLCQQYDNPEGSSNLELLLPYIHAGNVNEQDKYGKTLLHYSAQYGNLKQIEILLQRGANVNIQDRRGKTPLIYACQKTFFEIAKSFHDEFYTLNLPEDVLIEDLYYYEPEKYKSAKNKLKEFNDVAKKLIQAGTNINLADKRHYTATQYAIQNSRKDLFDILLNKNAGIYNTMAKAFSYPLYRDDVKTLEFIFRYPVHVNDQDEEGNTLLHYAADVLGGKSRKVIKYLLYLGADTKIKNNKGQNVYDIARANKDLETEKLLMKYENRGRASFNREKILGQHTIITKATLNKLKEPRYYY